MVLLNAVVNALYLTNVTARPNSPENGKFATKRKHVRHAASMTGIAKKCDWHHTYYGMATMIWLFVKLFVLKC